MIDFPVQRKTVKFDKHQEQSWRETTYLGLAPDDTSAQTKLSVMCAAALTNIGLALTFLN